MNEQERIKAMQRQRRLAEQKAKEADGSLETERRIAMERKKREELRRQQQLQAMKQRIILAAALIIIALVGAALILKSCAKKDKNPERQLPPQTSLEVPETQIIEPDNEPAAASQPSETALAIQEMPPIQTAESTTAPQAVSVAATVHEVNPSERIIDPSGIVIPNWITVDLIHINEISRPAIALDAVNDIAIHYVGNAGSSAKANRDYFDSLDNPAVEGAGRQASAHLIVGLEGEVVQCLPLNEMAYAVRSRNPDTISIEVCHPDETGKFSDVTYNTLVKLTAWLLQQKNLTPDHVIRHYDCDGKSCPLYYVEHEDAWNKLKQDIADYYYANPNIQ